MKKLFTLFFALSVWVGSYSQIRVALIGGPQSTSIEETNNIPDWKTVTSPYYSNRTGGNVGFLGEVALGASTRWFLHPAILYQTKGRKFFLRNDSTIANLTDTLTLSKTFFTSYIEIPFNLTYKIPLGKKVRFFLSAGPYVSFFYNGKQSVQARLLSDNSSTKEENAIDVGNAADKIETIDFGVNGRAGFDLGNILITGFASQGLNNFYTANYTGTFKHRVIGASVGFWLNKVKLPERKPKDSDRDGIADKDDACPTIPGLLVTAGCPDKDGDAIADKDDKCPEIPGATKYMGCPVPDSDLDGVNDEVDKCPSIPGTTKYDGCPVPDTDRDGIGDDSDLCPEKAGTIEFNGCPVPDSDGDGVQDKADKCPQEKGLPENNGCPEIKKEIIEKVNYAAKNIFFEFKSDKLSVNSNEALNEVAEILKNNPSLDLQIEGHTDNVGNPPYNLALSYRRAYSVKMYLTGQGVEDKRLRATGHGQEKPIADNKTKEGQAKNRRVELKTFLR